MTEFKAKSVLIKNSLSFTREPRQLQPMGWWFFIPDTNTFPPLLLLQRTQKISHFHLARCCGKDSEYQSHRSLEAQDLEQSLSKASFPIHLGLQYTILLYTTKLQKRQYRAVHIHSILRNKILARCRNLWKIPSLCGSSRRPSTR